MDDVIANETWVNSLSSAEIKEELARRELSTDGDETALRERLLRAIRYEFPPPRPSAQVTTLNASNTALGESYNSINQTNATAYQSPHSQGPPLGTTRRESNIARNISNVTRRDPSPIPLVFGNEDNPRNRGAISRRTQGQRPSVQDVMRKWNLRFSGARREDAESFLLRIEEGRAVDSLSDAEILRGLPFFLSGLALYWFRSHRNEWYSWEEFEYAWRNRFGDPDLQFTLRDEIHLRTQGEHEPVGDYLTCLRALFERLEPPWNEVEEINIAHRNMLPRLQIAVHRDDINSLAALETVAHRVERSFRRAQNYRAPPPPERSYFPDLAYQTSRNRSRQNAAFVAAELTPRRNIRPQRSNSSSPDRDSYHQERHFGSQSDLRYGEKYLDRDRNSRVNYRNYDRPNRRQTPPRYDEPRHDRHVTFDRPSYNNDSSRVRNNSGRRELTNNQNSRCDSSSHCNNNPRQCNYSCSHHHPCVNEYSCPHNHACSHRSSCSNKNSCSNNNPCSHNNSSSNNNSYSHNNSCSNNKPCSNNYSRSDNNSGQLNLLYGNNNSCSHNPRFSNNNSSSPNDSRAQSNPRPRNSYLSNNSRPNHNSRQNNNSNSYNHARENTERDSHNRRFNEPHNLANTNPFRNTEINAPNAAANSSNTSRRDTSNVCWNCQQPGHRSAKCPEPPRVHCYRCGKPGVITRNCSCSGNA